MAVSKINFLPTNTTNRTAEAGLTMAISFSGDQKDNACLRVRQNLGVITEASPLFMEKSNIFHALYIDIVTKKYDSYAVVFWLNIAHYLEAINTNLAVPHYCVTWQSCRTGRYGQVTRHFPHIVVR